MLASSVSDVQPQLPKNNKEGRISLSLSRSGRDLSILEKMPDMLGKEEDPCFEEVNIESERNHLTSGFTQSHFDVLEQLTPHADDEVFKCKHTINPNLCSCLAA